jgi:hypothetical protein
MSCAGLLAQRGYHPIEVAVLQHLRGRNHRASYLSQLIGHEMGCLYLPPERNVGLEERAIDATHDGSMALRRIAIGVRGMGSA